MEELLWTEVYNSWKMNQKVYTYVDEYAKYDFWMLNIMLTQRLLPVMPQTRGGVTNQFPAFHYFDHCWNTGYLELAEYHVNTL